MLNISAFIAAYLAMNCLCTSMQRNGKTITGQSLMAMPRFWLRMTGVLLLLLSLVAMIAGYGSSIGTVMWFGVLTLAATGVGLLLTYRPHWLRFSGPGMLIR